MHTYTQLYRIECFIFWWVVRACACVCESKQHTREEIKIEKVFVCIRTHVFVCVCAHICMYLRIHWVVVSNSSFNVAGSGNSPDTDWASSEVTDRRVSHFYPKFESSSLAIDTASRQCKPSIRVTVWNLAIYPFRQQTVGWLHRQSKIAIISRWPLRAADQW